MTELRKDPVVGRWVIISTERAKRPHEFPPEAAPRREGVCPLCPGSERMTPPEILAFRQGGEPNDPRAPRRGRPRRRAEGAPGALGEDGGRPGQGARRRLPAALAAADPRPREPAVQL